MKNYGNRLGACELVRFVQLHRIRGAESGDTLLAIIGLQGFFPLKGQAAMGIGALEAPSSERKRLAAL